MEGCYDNIYNISRSWSLSAPCPAYPPYLIETWPVTGSVSSQTPEERGEPVVPPHSTFQQENSQSTPVFLSVYKSCERLQRLQPGELPTFFDQFLFFNMDSSCKSLQNVLLFWYSKKLYHCITLRKEKILSSTFLSHYVV